MKMPLRMVLVVFALFTVSACGSSDVSDEASESDNVEAESTATTTLPDESVAEDTAVEATAEDTVAPETEGATVRVSGGTTDPWEIAGNCQWTPDNTGAASSLYVVEDTDDTREEEIGIFEVWPISLDDDSETSIIGSIVEPGGGLLSVIDVEPSFDGTTITLQVGVVTGVNFSETPEFIVTVTCGP